MLGDNLITRAVTKMDAKLATLDADTIESVEASATLEFDEWFALGDMASRAMLDGKIDADTAQTLHVIHTAFQSTATLAERLVFMQVATELLAARIGR